MVLEEKFKGISDGEVSKFSQLVFQLESYPKSTRLFGELHEFLLSLLKSNCKRDRSSFRFYGCNDRWNFKLSVGYIALDRVDHINVFWSGNPFPDRTNYLLLKRSKDNPLYRMEYIPPTGLEDWGVRAFDLDLMKSLYEFRPAELVVCRDKVVTTNVY